MWLIARKQKNQNIYNNTSDGIGGETRGVMLQILQWDVDVRQARELGYRGSLNVVSAVFFNDTYKIEESQKDDE